MNLTEFIAKFAGFADRTDKRLEEALSKHNVELSIEREKVAKLDASIVSLTNENAAIQSENAKLKASLVEAQSTASIQISNAKAEADKLAGENAANIVASAGFTQNVPAENQVSGTTKAEHWKRFNSLPEAERYPYWKKHREAMAD